MVIFCCPLLTRLVTRFTAASLPPEAADARFKFNLALNCANGRGVAVDEVEARRLYGDSH